MKTKEEMNEFLPMFPKPFQYIGDFGQGGILSIDHAPIMPTFAIPEDFGNGRGIQAKYTEKICFDEFTQDETEMVLE